MRKSYTVTGKQLARAYLCLRIERNMSNKELELKNRLDELHSNLDSLQTITMEFAVAIKDYADMYHSEMADIRKAVSLLTKAGQE